MASDNAWRRLSDHVRAVVGDDVWHRDFGRVAGDVWCGGTLRLVTADETAALVVEKNFARRLPEWASQVGAPVERVAVRYAPDIGARSVVELAAHRTARLGS